MPSIFCILKISTDPGLLKIRHSHRFVAVVIQFLIPLINTRCIVISSAEILTSIVFFQPLQELRLHINLKMLYF